MTDLRGWLARGPLGSRLRRARHRARRRFQQPTERWVRPGSVDFGTLRRLTPVSSAFGLDRGTGVDRHYIECFLRDHRNDIHGRVLEVGDDRYTRAFGEGRVTKSDVLHVDPSARSATITGDLSTGDGLPSDAFDCIVLTQTLQFVFDLRSALANARRALAPGGVLLATVPGISQLSRYDADRWGEFWRLTAQSAARLAQEAFGPRAVTVRSFGNVMSAVALLHGLAAEELTQAELAALDPDYEVLVAIRAVKEPLP